MPSEALALRGVEVQLGGRPVLSGADLDLAEGLTALVGPNGSGKTTLLRLACGLLRPRRGQVLLAGTPAHRLPASRRRRLVGYLPQRAQDAFLSARVADEVGAAAQEEFGIAHLADRHPLALSEGERRRVALAAALGERPDVLLADEPTAGLDAGAAQEVAARLAARSGPSLLATHDWDLVMACDRVVVLSGGRLHPAGSPSEFADGPWARTLGWTA